MDKLKLSEWGERLKTSGAQMGRMVSGKMKEILQSPTPESKMVDDATSETLEEPNWGMNMRICALISSEEVSGTEIVKAIKRKIAGKDVRSQMLSLELLEACTTNCDKVYSEVASEKVLDEMVKMIENPQTDHWNRQRALQLIRSWGQSEDLAYLPVFRQTHMNLNERNANSSVGDWNAPPLDYYLGSYDQQQPVPAGNYPVPETGLRGAHDNVFSYNYGTLSAEQKKEFFEITRNSLEVLSSMLNSETEPKPLQDELTLGMLEKCKQSQPVIQMIIESTGDDDGILFEALNLNDELQKIISRYEELEADLSTKVPSSADHGTIEASVSAHIGSPKEAPPVKDDFSKGDGESQPKP